MSLLQHPNGKALILSNIRFSFYFPKDSFLDIRVVSFCDVSESESMPVISIMAIQLYTLGGVCPMHRCPADVGNYRPSDWHFGLAVSVMRCPVSVNGCQG